MKWKRRLLKILTRIVLIASYHQLMVDFAVHHLPVSLSSSSIIIPLLGRCWLQIKSSFLISGSIYHGVVGSRSRPRDSINEQLTWLNLVDYKDCVARPVDEWVDGKKAWRSCWWVAEYQFGTHWPPLCCRIKLDCLQYVWLSISTTHWCQKQERRKVFLKGGAAWSETRFSNDGVSPTNWSALVIMAYLLQPSLPKLL